MVLPVIVIPPVTVGLRKLELPETERVPPIVVEPPRAVVPATLRVVMFEVVLVKLFEVKLAILAYSPPWKFALGFGMDIPTGIRATGFGEEL